jgi:hypothetical protein
VVLKLAILNIFYVSLPFSRYSLSGGDFSIFNDPTPFYPVGSWGNQLHYSLNGFSIYIYFSSLELTLLSGFDRSIGAFFHVFLLTIGRTSVRANRIYFPFLPLYWLLFSNRL